MDFWQLLLNLDLEMFLKREGIICVENYSEYCQKFLWMEKIQRRVKGVKNEGGGGLNLIGMGWKRIFGLCFFFFILICSSIYIYIGILIFVLLGQ